MKITYIVGMEEINFEVKSEVRKPKPTHKISKRLGRL